MTNTTETIKLLVPDYSNLSKDTEAYDDLKPAFQYVVENWKRHVDFAQLTYSCDYESADLQKLFGRWMGVADGDRLLGCLNLSAAKQFLRESEIAAKSQHLREISVSLQEMTDIEYRKCGGGMLIHYGWHNTVFGKTLILVSDGALCGLAFIAPEETPASCLARMRKAWSRSRFEANLESTQAAFDTLFGRGKELKLLLKGTNFQREVWRALLQIAPGQWESYKSLAESIGRNSRSARAVGAANGKNPISLIVPCHRVIAADGKLGGYGWGVERKAAMLAAEAKAASTYL